MKVNKLTIDQVIEKLELEPLEPEGGYFRRTYVSKKNLTNPPRPAMTCIYYLITKDNFSAFHRIGSDEIYHFYAGDQVQLFLINKHGTLEVVELGNELTNAFPQWIVEKEVWQACRIKKGEDRGWSLLGTTVSPGFDFKDFEIGKKLELSKKFPSLVEIIESLTR